MLYNNLTYGMYKNKNIKINEDLYSKNREDDIVPYIIDILKSYERVPNIKLINWEHITDDTQIDPYIVNKRYSKSKIDYKKSQPIDEDRFELLKVHFEVDGKRFIPGKSKEDNFPFTIEILLPKRYKKFYYMLGGNKFYPIYQLIESSTYSMKNSVVLKPMNVVRDKVSYYDLDSVEYDSIKYSLLVFGKKINPLLLYCAAMGLNNTLNYLFMQDIIEINPYDSEYDYYSNDSDDMLHFRCKNNVISVVKYFYENDRFVQSIIGNLLDILADKVFVTRDDLDDRDIWAEKLGAYYTTASVKFPEKRISKAKEILGSFTSLATNIYKSNLKLDHIHKDTMFSILRWLMQNFTELKLKDSLDIKNKRIRLNEYIADYFSQVVNSKLNRFLSISSKNTQIGEKELKNLFSYRLNALVSKLQSKSPLLRYDDSVNDLDFFTAFKYSIKGPSSVSSTSSQIPISLMTLHHSYVGRIDLTSSSSSEPNVTGYFTPFAETHEGKFFDTSSEPQGWLIRFCKMYANYYNGEEFKIEPLNLYEDMVRENDRLFKKLHDIDKFVANYTGSDQKIKIVDVDGSSRGRVKVMRPTTRILHKKSRSLFKNVEKEPMVIRELFKRKPSKDTKRK